MTYAEMKDVFRPVIEEVLALLNDQIKAASKHGPISAVILVGGFGESTYLYRQIKQAVSPIPVLQPPNGSVYSYYFLSHMQIPLTCILTFLIL